MVQGTLATHARPLSRLLPEGHVAGRRASRPAPPPPAAGSGYTCASCSPPLRPPPHCPWLLPACLCPQLPLGFYTSPPAMPLCADAREVTFREPWSGLGSAARPSDGWSPRRNVCRRPSGRCGPCGLPPCPPFRQASPVETTEVGMAVTPCRGGGDVTVPAVSDGKGATVTQDDNVGTSR